MKKIILLALVLTAGASLSGAFADKKKNKKVNQTATTEPIQLLSGSDSLSYAAGMAQTNGLIPYITQQLRVDTAYMQDFMHGLMMGTKTVEDPAARARFVGLQIGNMIVERMIPSISEQLKDSPDSLNAELFKKGFLASLKKDTLLYTQEAAERFFQDRMAADKAAKSEKQYGANRRAGEEFLAENGKKEGVVTLPSGLQYKVIVKGEGEIPRDTSKVIVKYEGKTVDGKIFDSSYTRTDPTNTFQANRLIKGWTEALTRMPVGSTWELFIPYQLAYGESGSGEIKPYSALIFKVELIGIEKPAEKEKVQVQQKTAKKTTKKRK